MQATSEKNPGTHPRVAPKVVHFVTHEEINHISLTIPIATHDMAYQIEVETLPWSLFNSVVNPYKGVILQYKDLMHSKYEKTRSFWKNGLSKKFGKLTDGFPGKFQKGTNTISFVTRNNIPV